MKTTLTTTGLVMIIMFSFAGFACSPSPDGGAARAAIPEPAHDADPNNADAEMQHAVFAGGCFWCTEGVFEQVQGVQEVVSGYAGGDAQDADYRKVASGRTEHAEAIRITYQPARVTYGKLMQIFFATHDPTQLNRQGPDVGPQYRSAIFYADQHEKQLAERYIAQLNEAGVYDKPIVTTLEPLEEFYVAEEYHQDFVERNPRQGYVRMYALPKIEKVRKHFPDAVKAEEG